ncbi:hypothetical protein EG328_000958 [Venturia inaequalis]|uniref:Uncharacterized protein n=1 Tax=Venturia inaequalis TaxID=5025 RepID=A0A8H3Z769_VENIN|nr:hypothetical protein EG328_000958 [Venturia inaequalis]
MQFLSITAVLLNLVLIQDVSAAICTTGRPAQCQEVPCKTLTNEPGFVCSNEVWSPPDVFVWRSFADMLE